MKKQLNAFLNKLQYHFRNNSFDILFIPRHRPVLMPIPLTLPRRLAAQVQAR